MKFRKLTILAVSLMLLVAFGFGCTTTQSATKEAPAKAAADWKFHDIVDVKFVQKYAVMPQPENVMIIDSRPKRPKYDKGYIPTAVSIPDSQFAKMTDKLPKDKDALLIFYCEGPT
jgi:3-mercaptopyruvate sulfurtransferase SseA